MAVHSETARRAWTVILPGLKQWFLHLLWHIDAGRIPQPMYEGSFDHLSWEQLPGFFTWELLSALLEVHILPKAAYDLSLIGQGQLVALDWWHHQEWCSVLFICLSMELLMLCMRWHLYASHTNTWSPYSFDPILCQLLVYPSISSESHHYYFCHLLLLYLTIQ